jgi:N-acetyl-gamma-glutamyl-phosphate reductase
MDELDKLTDKQLEQLERKLHKLYKDAADESGFASAGKLSGTDQMEITVAGNDDRILLIARYDNLGKGASGAAVECMNIVIGAERTKGLEL